MRLIDIEPFETEKDVTTCQITRWHNGDGYSEMAVTNTKDIPTIEAEPVKHGRWVYDSCEMEFFCSVCSREAPVGMTTYHITNYCPACGAKMDLEVSDATG